jgi:protein required for attachment to host cells
MKPVRTWVLIADGGRARILENDGPNRGLRPVEGMEFQTELPPTRELVTDRPGRDHESVGQTRHAYQSHSDPHRELKRKFATMLAQTLEKKRLEKAYDRLVVVAPAGTMGDLRGALPPDVKKSVMGEIVEDLTHAPNDKIGPYLDGVLVV